MNKKDFSYLKSEIEKAESNMKFYQSLDDRKEDIYFWKGYLNSLNLMWLQAKNNYKL